MVLADVVINAIDLTSVDVAAANLTTLDPVTVDVVDQLIMSFVNLAAPNLV